MLINLQTKKVMLLLLNLSIKLFKSFLNLFVKSPRLFYAIPIIISFHACNYLDDKKQEELEEKEKNKLEEKILEKIKFYNAKELGDQFENLYSFQANDTIDKYQNTVFIIEGSIEDIKHLDSTSYLIYLKSHKSVLNIKANKASVSQISEITSISDRKRVCFFVNLLEFRYINRFTPELSDYNIYGEDDLEYFIELDDQKFLQMDCTLVDWVLTKDDYYPFLYH